MITASGLSHTCLNWFLLWLGAVSKNIFNGTACFFPCADFVPIDLEEWWAQRFLANIANLSWLSAARVRTGSTTLMLCSWRHRISGEKQNLRCKEVVHNWKWCPVLHADVEKSEGTAWNRPLIQQQWPDCDLWQGGLDVELLRRTCLSLY